MASVKQIKRARALLKQYKTLKTIPAVAARLIQMLNNDAASFKDFEGVIQVDPTLVLRVLKLVNSPYYALRSKITSISEAVAYIGVDNLRNMIVVDALKHAFSKPSSIEGFSRPRLWLHCAAVSICSQMISERVFATKGEDAFLCGLLHDFGFMVEDQTAPTQFAILCKTVDLKSQGLISHENALFDTDHPTICGQLTRDWGISEEICHSIETHHDTKGPLSPESLGGIIRISEYLVVKLGYDAFPEGGDLPDSILTHMKGRILDYKAILGDLPDEMKRAEDIYSLKDH